MRVKIIDRQFLTKKEVSLLPYFCNGMTKPQIAAQIHRAKGTVCCHAENILFKLQASNMTEAVCRAIELNIIKIICLMLVCVFASGHRVDMRAARGGYRVPSVARLSRVRELC